jgi:hypothetical protein
MGTKNKKHKKQKAMAKLLHSKPNSFIHKNHTLKQPFVFNLFYFNFIFGKLMQHLSP